VSRFATRVPPTSPCSRPSSKRNRGLKTNKEFVNCLCAEEYHVKIQLGPSLVNIMVSMSLMCRKAGARTDPVRLSNVELFARAVPLLIRANRAYFKDAATTYGLMFATVATVARRTHQHHLWVVQTSYFLLPTAETFYKTERDTLHSTTSLRDSTGGSARFYSERGTMSYC
jgi:hypothetical protein